VAESIGVMDGGGSYFDLHTGINGFGLRFGLKVDDATMVTFLKRFGVSQEHIAVLPLATIPRATRPDAPIQVHPSCTLCGLPAKNKCTNCRQVYYCSKGCQRLEWPLHKIFCQMETIPNAIANQRSVRAILFPEREERPKFVHLPLERMEESSDLDPPGWKLEKGEYIHGISGFCRSDLQKGYNDDDQSCAYHILFKDDVLVDGESQDNVCVATVLKAKVKSVIKNVESFSIPAHWRNNILIIKSGKYQKYSSCDCDNEYEDMRLEDVSHSVRYLFKASMDYSNSS
jgi:hypothetical protein